MVHQVSHSLAAVQSTHLIMSQVTTPCIAQETVAPLIQWDQFEVPPVRQRIALQPSHKPREPARSPQAPAHLHPMHLKCSLQKTLAVEGQ